MLVVSVLCLLLSLGIIDIPVIFSLSSVFAMPVATQSLNHISFMASKLRALRQNTFQADAFLQTSAHLPLLNFSHPLTSTM